VFYWFIKTGRFEGKISSPAFAGDEMLAKSSKKMVLGKWYQEKWYQEKWYQDN